MEIFKEASAIKWEPKNSENRQIIVLMSGGVDSSVTALLLKKKGYDVLGITMIIPSANSSEKACNGKDGAKTAYELGIPHYSINISDEFERLVINPFQQEYINGKTPSPCTDCNSKIKFGILWDFLKKQFHINNMATGHYAKIYKDEEGYHLARGEDKNRDQSYFLYGIKKEALPYLYFPLEPYTKEEVRQIAAENNIETAEKPDSMELCFAENGNYKNALSSVSKPGIIIDTKGNFLKEHTGIEKYTIGQRKGLGVSAPYPLYVTDINPITNTVTLGKREEGLTDTVNIYDINILEPQKAKENCICFGKNRSNGDPKPCRITDISSDYATVKYENEFFRVSAGQKCVLYDSSNNIILGGTIK